MSAGYDKLKAAVDKDCVKDGGTMHQEGCVACGEKCSHKYCDKFKWVIDRAKAYGEAIGLNWEDVLDGWETDRNYWYMNYYQDCNQPEIKAGKVRVFGTILELKEAIGEMKFRCPSCGKESPNPYECKVWLESLRPSGRHGERRFCLCKGTTQRRDHVHADILGGGQSMIFRNGTHAEEWAAAIYRADAHRDDDTANPYFGASLFLITAVPGLYDRVKEHIHNGWADYSEMLEMNLSSGERLIVELAGNFYNGGFFDGYKPSDIIEKLDADTVELVARAFVLRRQRIDMNTIFD